jgi:hypothetical protein
MWYYRQNFENMEKAGILNSNDALQRASFVFVYLPILQEAVARFVEIWNSHQVRKINVNGCFHSSHIPVVFFQEWERLRG